MADPPWDIHMELPYGTMEDEQMRRLAIPQLQVAKTRRKLWFEALSAP